MSQFPNTEHLFPVIHLQRCDGCGLCVRACLKQALGLVNQKAAVIAPEACDYLGSCEQICPRHAIERLFQIISLPRRLL